MEFSHCGKLLASGGQDHVLRVWVLKDFLAFFQQMRDKYNEGKKKTASCFISFLVCTLCTVHVPEVSPCRALAPK